MQKMNLSFNKVELNKRKEGYHCPYLNSIQEKNLQNIEDRYNLNSDNGGIKKTELQKNPIKNYKSFNNSEQAWVKKSFNIKYSK